MKKTLADKTETECRERSECGPAPGKMESALIRIVSLSCLALFQLILLKIVFYDNIIKPSNREGQVKEVDRELDAFVESIERPPLGAEDQVRNVENLPIVAGFNAYNVRTSDGQWRTCNVTSAVYSSCDQDYLDGDKPFVAVVDNFICGGYGACKGDIVCFGGYKKSGGEYRACERLLIMINNHGYDVMFFNTEIEFAVEYFQQLLHRKKPRIALGSNRGNIDQIPSVKKDGMNRPLSPFSEQCMLMSSYWGKTAKRLKIWVGGVSRVVTPLPTPGNTFVGLKVDLCQRDDLRPSGNVSEEDIYVPVSVQSSTRQLMIGDQGEPYALLIGKWDSTGKVRHIHETFKKKKVWDYISNRTNLVVLDCTDEFLEVSNIVAKNVICLYKDSDFRQAKYKSLVHHAQFVLGIGSPHHSPSPLEALSCSVPVILARDMHWYVESYVSKPAAFIVDTEEEVEYAVDSILSSNKNHTLSSLKKNSRDALHQLTADVREPGLKALLEEVQAACAQHMKLGFYVSESDLPSLNITM